MRWRRLHSFYPREEGPSFATRAPAVQGAQLCLPRPLTHRAPCREAAALMTALTPGRSRDVDRRRRVVVSIVPPPQKLRTDTQSACPAQGLNTSNLQERELPAGSSQVNLAISAQRTEVLAGARQDPRHAPGGHPCQGTIPFQWSSTSFSAQAHPDAFYSHKQTPVIPVTFWHRADSQLVAYFGEGGLLSDFSFPWGNH